MWALSTKDISWAKLLKLDTKKTRCVLVRFHWACAIYVPPGFWCLLFTWTSSCSGSCFFFGISSFAVLTFLRHLQLCDTLIIESIRVLPMERAVYSLFTHSLVLIKPFNFIYAVTDWLTICQHKPGSLKQHLEKSFLICTETCYNKVRLCRVP